jgi:glycosyltransferase involved in cell wall biosynthesis
LSRATILLTSTFVTPFINEDLTLLRKHFDVEHLIVKGPLASAAIVRGVQRSDLVFSWFASTYAASAVFSARLFNRKSVIVIGGVDVAGLAVISYGPWVSPWKSRLVGYALRNADRVLAVDPFLKEEALRRAGYNGDNISCLPTGYDASFWTPSGPKERLVLSVAVCDTEARLSVKGVDLLLDAARILVDVPFLLVGIHPRLLGAVRRRATANVEIRDTVAREELRTLYRRAKVYCQPSRVEGLPNAVCEAMLCECVPVATDVGGMRSALGKEGVLIPYGDAAGLARAIAEGLAMAAPAGTEARQFIAARYTVERREEGLLQTVRELLP